MFSTWDSMSDELQLVVSKEALTQAAETIAGQAEILAAEMEGGFLLDRGGPEALRLFAAIVRVTGRTPADTLMGPPAGRA